MAKKAQSKKTSTKRAPAKKPSGEQKAQEPAQEPAQASAQKSAQASAKEAGAKTAETKSRLDEAMDTVVAGASKGMERVSEEAPKVAAKTSEVAKEGYGKLKHGLSVAYDRGSKLSRVAYREAKEQAEKFKHTMEMRKLKSRREELCADLGKAAYGDIVARGKAAADAFADDRFVRLIEEIRQVDEEIVEVAKELDED